MNNRLLMLPLSLPLAAAVLLGGCVTVPTSPTVMVLPGPQKTLDQFQSDGMACQEFAQNVVAPSGVAAANNAAANAAVGTALGAAAGTVPTTPVTIARGGPAATLEAGRHCTDVYSRGEY